MENLKTILNRMILGLGLFMMFGILFVPGLREKIGNVIGIVLNPFLNFMPLHMIILILASLTGLYASLIQKYTMDWELIRRVQERMKNFQKELREANLVSNTARMKKLEAQRKDMMEDQMVMMKQQFKPMLYISIISMPLFFWVYLAIGKHPDTSIIFPFWGEQKLTGLVLGPIQYWIYWYFICSLPVSQMIRKALNIGGM